ncbi:MAG: hypothetical protein ABJE47_19850 [bacterium]
MHLRLRVPVLHYGLMAAGTVLLAGCGTKCSLVAFSTLQVTVVASQSGKTINAGSTVIVRGRAVYDSVTVAASDSTRQFAYQGDESRVPAGDYTVTVRHSGYREWVSSATVEQNGCHAGRGPTITATLVATP